MNVKKKTLKQRICEGNYIWNPSICVCECDKHLNNCA